MDCKMLSYVTICSIFLTFILALEPWTAVHFENNRKVQEVFLQPLEREV